MQENIKFLGNFTEAMKEFCSDKILKVEKYMNVSYATVKYNSYKNNNISVEISLDNKVRASKLGEDFYALVQDVVEKLIQQIKRYGKYTKEYKKPVDFLNFEEDEDKEEYINPLISRIKEVDLKVMSDEDAIETMNLLGHSFFVYRDQDEKVRLIYAKEDGTYGLLKCF